MNQQGTECPLLRARRKEKQGKRLGASHLDKMVRSLWRSPLSKDMEELARKLVGMWRERARGRGGRGRRSKCKVSSFEMGVRLVGARD